MSLVHLLFTKRFRYQTNCKEKYTKKFNHNDAGQKKRNRKKKTKKKQKKQKNLFHLWSYLKVLKKYAFNLSVEKGHLNLFDENKLILC